MSSKELQKGDTRKRVEFKFSEADFVTLKQLEEREKYGFGAMKDGVRFEISEERLKEMEEALAGGLFIEE